MWNPGTIPVTVLEVLTPGGTEKWFEEITQLKSGDKKGFESARKRHGIKFLTKSHWTEDIGRKFGLI